MRRHLTTGFFVTFLALAGCSKTTAPAPGPVATVTLKDGSTFSGTVTKSDTAAITLQASTGESRTYPMTQVSGVQYAPDQSSSQSGAAQNAPGQSPAGAPPPPPMPSPSVQPVAPPQQSVEVRPASGVVRTIPAGTTIEVRNNAPINSEVASPGQTYSGVVARDIVDTEGRVAIPRGSNATLVVRDASGQGKVQGRSELVLDVASVTVNGREHRLETSDFVERGQQGVGKNKRTGEFAGGGAALGGIIGAIAGGGKGAAIGALAGGGAGAAAQVATRGKAVRVPSETLLRFTIEAPVHLREM